MELKDIVHFPWTLKSQFQHSHFHRLLATQSEAREQVMRRPWCGWCPATSECPCASEPSYLGWVPWSLLLVHLLLSHVQLNNPPRHPEAAYGVNCNLGWHTGHHVCLCWCHPGIQCSSVYAVSEGTGPFLVLLVLGRVGRDSPVLLLHDPSTES